MNYNKIEILREQKNFTKKDVYRAVGKSRQWYNDIFTVKNIRVDDLIVIARLFDVPINYFFEDEKNGYNDISQVNEQNIKYENDDVLKFFKKQIELKDGQIKFLQSLINK
jgi:transcriptional regulator with XRE-family HTH domain